MPKKSRKKNNLNQIIKKRVIFFIVFFAFVDFIFPWDPFNSPKKVSDWQKQLEHLPDSKKSIILNKIANEYVTHDFEADKAVEYGQKALEVAKKFQQKDQEIRALANIGNAFRRLEKPVEAEKTLLKAIKLADEFNHEEEILYVLNVLSIFYFRTNNVSKAKGYSNRAINICRKSNNRRGFISLFPWASNILWQNNEKDIAKRYLNEAISICHEMADTNNEVNLMITKANMVRLEKKYDASLEILIKALKKFENEEKNMLIPRLYLEIGAIYHYLSDLIKAKEYYLMAISYYGDKEIDIYKIQVYSELGKIYFLSKDYRPALYYSFQARKLLKEMKCQNPYLEESILTQIGEIYFLQNQYNMAKKYYQEALRIVIKNKHFDQIPEYFINLGKVLTKENKFSEAEKLLLKALDSFKKKNIDFELQVCYGYLALLYASWGKFKSAYEYHVKSVEEYEKHFTVVQREKIAEIQTIYEIDKKEKELELIKSKNELMAKENEIKNLTIKQQKTMRNAAIIISILLILIFIQFLRKFSYLLMFWKKKNYIGQYRLTEKIATGGMGQVFKAHPVKNKTQTLAIKVLKEEFADDEIFKKRFKNEAAIIDQINHPHIVKVIERGEYEGGFYIAMEYLTGKTLETILKDKKALDFDLIISILVQIVEVIVKVHQNNIVHRDLKPENIMLVETPDNPHFVKLLDFGIARSTLQTRLTLAGNIVGTVRYMSPEQLQGADDLSFASDIFSLGVIAYEMVTGTQAFADDLEKAALQIAKEEIPDPITIRKDCPVSLNGLIKRMMSKQAQLRPTAKEVLAELSRYMPTPAQP